MGRTMFKNGLKLSLAAALIIGFSGCASLNSVSLTSVPAHRTHPVKTERSKWIVLGLNFDNDFVDDAVEDLKRQCPNGRVTGILTKDEVIAYVLFWKRSVTATGYCLARSAGQSAKSSRKSASEPHDFGSEVH